MSAEESGLLRLANDQISIAVRADLGGKVISLRDANGLEWLSRSDRPYAKRSDGMSYGSSEFDGIDEIFPNLNKEELTLADGRKVSLNDHGEVWTKVWTRLDEPGIALAVEGSDFPYRLERRIRLEGASVVFSYRLVHTGTEPFPYAYCFHPLWAIHAGLRVEMLAEQPCIWLYGKGVEGLGKGEDFPWSQSAAAIGPIRAESGRFWKVVAKHVSGPVRLVNGSGAALRMEWDTTVHPHAAFWCSESGVSNLQHLACEPATSPQDALSAAIADSTARTLSPGEVHSWTITVHLEPSHESAP